MGKNYNAHLIILLIGYGCNWLLLAIFTMKKNTIYTIQADVATAEFSEATGKKIKEYSLTYLLSVVLCIPFSAPPPENPSSLTACCYIPTIF